jgi:multidrug efflux system membrane fusion protein
MNRSILLAALLAIAATAWVASGQFDADGGDPALRNPPAPLDAKPEPKSVRVHSFAARPAATELVINGHTEALRGVDIKAEIRGAIAELPVEKGQPVAAGARLATIAELERPALLAEARALLAQRRIEFEAASKLKERGFRAETQLAATKANYEAAQAAVRRAEVQIGQLTLTAPFEGVLQERYVELGDYLDVGDPVARVVDLDPLLVIAYANERDVQQLELEAPGSVRLITGEELTGHIRYISPTADERTRTYRIELAVSNPGYRLPAGMTAELRLPTGQQPAHLVSPALLVLGADGGIGVRSVDADNRVRTLPVGLLDQGPEGVWITGLPARVTLITVGQQFVVDGQEVRPVPAEDISAAAPETPR